MFSLGRFLKMKEVAQNFGLLFPRLIVMYYFRQEWVVLRYVLLLTRMGCATFCVTFSPKSSDHPGPYPTQPKLAIIENLQQAVRRISGECCDPIQQNYDKCSLANLQYYKYVNDMPSKNDL
jgi:hypothetical protein